MPAYYVPIIMMFLTLYILRLNRRIAIVRRITRNRKKRNKEELTLMTELAKRFIGKNCLLYAYDGHQFDGIVLEVTDHAILIEKKGQPEIVNLEFVMRIREFPTNKKGKGKPVVMD